MVPQRIGWLQSMTSLSGRISSTSPAPSSLRRLYSSCWALRCACSRHPWGNVVLLPLLYMENWLTHASQLLGNPPVRGDTHNYTIYVYIHIHMYIHMKSYMNIYLYIYILITYNRTCACPRGPEEKGAPCPSLPPLVVLRPSVLFLAVCPYEVAKLEGTLATWIGCWCAIFLGWAMLGSWVGRVGASS